MLCVMQVFHLDCFHCSACDHKLQPGEQYALSSGKLFCQNHFDSLPLDQPATCTPLGIPLFMTCYLCVLCVSVCGLNMWLPVVFLLLGWMAFTLLLVCHGLPV